jgi:membrane protein
MIAKEESMAHTPSTVTPRAHRSPRGDDLAALIVATVKRSLRDNCSGRAAQAAYHILFAIFPLAIFAAALSALANSLFGLDLFDAIMASLASVLPQEARVTIVAPIAAVVNHPSGWLILVGIVTALWSGATAVGTFITALNRAYDVEETRPWWRRKGLEILLTLGMGAVVVAAFVLIVFGGRLGAAIAAQIGLGGTFRVAWQIGRWPLIAVIIMTALTVFYRVGSNSAQRARGKPAGAILGTLVWIATVSGFGAYVGRFGRYDKTYGTLGGVIILLLAFYLTALIVIVGGELNAEIARRHDPAAMLPSQVADLGDRSLVVR